MNTSKILLGCSLVAIASMTLLANSINSKQEERQEINTSPVVKEKGVEAKNEEWAKYYPRQYDSWKQTSKSDKIDDLLIKKPQLAILWAGYRFPKDFTTPHAAIFTPFRTISTPCVPAPRSVR